MLTFDGMRIVLDDFELSADLQIGAGRRIAVVGPSGAGKSTFLGAIGGFVAVYEGRITWEGERIDGLPPSDRPVSIIFQDNNLFPHLSVEKNVGLGLRPNGRLSAEDRDRVEDALASVGLGGMGGRKPGTLSGGQQSRVALARAALQDRPVILLDEPFAALGPALKAEMIDLLLGLAEDRRATLVMVTHAPEDARRLGGETVLVAAGMAHPPQDTDALLSDPPEALRDYLGGVG